MRRREVRWRKVPEVERQGSGSERRRVGMVGWRT